MGFSVLLADTQSYTAADMALMNVITESHLHIIHVKTVDRWLKLLGWH